MVKTHLDEPTTAELEALGAADVVRIRHAFADEARFNATVHGALRHHPDGTNDAGTAGWPREKWLAAVLPEAAAS